MQPPDNSVNWFIEQRFGPFNNSLNSLVAASDDQHDSLSFDIDSQTVLQSVPHEKQKPGYWSYARYALFYDLWLTDDLHAGFPGSKCAGAEWAKTTLDPSWSELIDRAWDGRPNPALSVRQPADPEAFDNTLKFIQYVINESKLYAAPDPLW